MGFLIKPEHMSEESKRKMREQAIKMAKEIQMEQTEQKVGLFYKRDRLGQKPPVPFMAGVRPVETQEDAEELFLITSSTGGRLQVSRADAVIIWGALGVALGKEGE